MRRGFIITLLVTAIGIAAWVGVWRSGMGTHVALIERSIAHYNQQFKTSSSRSTLKVSGIEAAGFPFAQRVVLRNPSISMVWGEETYAVEMSYITLALEDEREGRYRVTLAPESNALYAQPNRAPESYHVLLNAAPDIWARAGQGATPETILTQIGIATPHDILLEARLGTSSKKIGFPARTMPLPLFIPIPNDPSRGVSLYVGMLREALVYGTAR
jgi:hypothetical protein